MKLQHFVAPVKEAQKLRDLGKTLIGGTPGAKMPVVEAARPTKAAAPQDEDGMDAAIHTITADSKHLHKKLAHHD